MNNENEYLVYIAENGMRYYYKNQKLHREDAPAIISPVDENMPNYLALASESLYKVVKEPVCPEDCIYMETVTLSDNIQVTRKGPPIISRRSIYCFEGDKYSKEDFDRIIFKNNMEKELNSKISRTNKVKI